MSTTETTTHRPRVAVIGYGSQGRAHALNLRDSGFDVTIGLRPGGPTSIKAIADGFSVSTPAEAVAGAQIVAVLTPDMVQADLYTQVIEPNITQGACLLFAHGFNVHYGQVTPRADLDVVLVAPKGPGALVRREFEIGRGVPAVYAVHQDRSGNAEKLALTYCAGIGGAARTRSRPPSRKKPKPTCSASRRCCAAARPSWSRPVSRPWSRRATSPRWPITSVCMS